jgi:hypothetical protein
MKFHLVLSSLCPKYFASRNYCSYLEPTIHLNTPKTFLYRPEDIYLCYEPTMHLNTPKIFLYRPEDKRKDSKLQV